MGHGILDFGRAPMGRRCRHSWRTAVGKAREKREDSTPVGKDDGALRTSTLTRKGTDVVLRTTTSTVTQHVDEGRCRQLGFAGCRCRGATPSPCNANGRARALRTGFPATPDPPEDRLTIRLFRSFLLRAKRGAFVCQRFTNKRLFETLVACLASRPAWLHR